MRVLKGRVRAFRSRHVLEADYWSMNLKRLIAKAKRPAIRYRVSMRRLPNALYFMSSEGIFALEPTGDLTVPYRKVSFDATP